MQKNGLFITTHCANKSPSFASLWYVYLCTEEYIQRNSTARVFKRYIFVHATNKYFVPFPCLPKGLFNILSNPEHMRTSYELMSSCWILLTLFLTPKLDLQHKLKTHNSYISLKAADFLSSNRYIALLHFFCTYVYTANGTFLNDCHVNQFTEYRWWELTVV